MVRSSRSTAQVTSAPNGGVLTGGAAVGRPQTKKLAERTSTVALAGRLQVRADEEPWTVTELDEVLQELHEQHARLLTGLAEREAELTGLMRDSGDGAGQDTADVGATAFERDQEIQVMNTEREILEAVETVLTRIEDGTFGICERCEQPIGKMRVMAFPRATLCLSCKQREERR